MVTSKMRFIGKASWQALLGGLLAVLIVSGCGNKKQVGLPTGPAPIESPTVHLDQIEVTALGKVEGPYYFIKAISPTQVELANMEAKTEVFSLFGLSEYAEVPEATPTPDTNSQTPNPAATPTPPVEKTAAQKERENQIRLFQMAAFESICGKKQLWLVRMTTDVAPAGVYLFLPQNPQGNHDNPAGPACLINAMALYQGQATMDLSLPRHPLYDKMLDSELYSVIQARRKKGTDDIWNRFGLKLPQGDHEARLAEMEKMM